MGSIAEHGGMKDGDYIVSINEEEVKWSPHDQVVSMIKKSGNNLKMRLVTPLDKKEVNSSKTDLKLRGSSSPTSCASSTSGHSSGGVQSFSHQSGDLSSSPASSVTSGSTRSNKASSTEGPSKKQHLNNPLVNGNSSWNPFRKSGGASGQVTARCINENIIMR